MLARLRFGRLLVVAARVPVFAFALVILIGTVTISGANALLREALRARARARVTPTGPRAPASTRRPSPRVGRASTGDGHQAVTAGWAGPAPHKDRNRPRARPLG